jgi:hypothetical protein
MGTGRRGNSGGTTLRCTAVLHRAQTITPLLRRRMTALDDERQHQSRVLLLDGCESGAGADVRPGDASLSSNPVTYRLNGCVVALRRKQ